MRHLMIITILFTLTACGGAGGKQRVSDGHLQALMGDTAIILLAHSDFPSDLQQQLIQHYQHQLPGVRFLPDINCINRHTCILAAEKKGMKKLVLVNSSAVLSSGGREHEVTGTLNLCVGLYEVATEKMLTTAEIFSYHLPASDDHHVDWEMAIKKVAGQEKYGKHLAQVATCTKGRC